MQRKATYLKNKKILAILIGLCLVATVSLYWIGFPIIPKFFKVHLDDAFGDKITYLDFGESEYWLDPMPGRLVVLVKGLDAKELIHALEQSGYQLLPGGKGLPTESPKRDISTVWRLYEHPNTPGSVSVRSPEFIILKRRTVEHSLYAGIVASDDNAYADKIYFAYY